MEQKSAKELVAEASRQIATLAADDAVKLADDPNTVFVDVREGEELEKTGKLQGAASAEDEVILAEFFKRYGIAEQHDSCGEVTSAEASLSKPHLDAEGWNETGPEKRK